jgi:hypothetical protein
MQKKNGDRNNCKKLRGKNVGCLLCHASIYHKSSYCKSSRCKEDGGDVSSAGMEEDYPRGGCIDFGKMLQSDGH